jgi:hypothetical protein
MTVLLPNIIGKRAQFQGVNHRNGLFICKGVDNVTMKNLAIKGIKTLSI